MSVRSNVVVALLALGAAACSGNLFVGQQGTQTAPSAGAATSGSPNAAGTGQSSGAGTGASGTTGGSSATTGIPGGSGAGSGTTNGTGTGGNSDVIGPIDGGYVFCELLANPDAGPDTLGTRWMCPPSTYICDLALPGNCFQCLSDADCGDPELPTYDPRRLKCDLSSGVSGYQGYCQECLASSDCARNPTARTCDLNPADHQPSIVDVGFEACVCAPDGGKTCPELTCDPATCPPSKSCTSDLFCGNGNPYCFDGGCAQCRTNADCTHLRGSGYCGSNGYCADAVKNCASDADCAGIVFAESCVATGAGDACGCGSDPDCIGSPFGPRCDQRVTSPTYGNCGCQAAFDCGPGQTCPSVPSRISTCSSFCDQGHCPAGYFCDATNTCRSRCDPGHACAPEEPICDVDDVANRNSAGVTWCYPCATASDCPEGQACSNTQQCGSCSSSTPCRPGELCASDLTCRRTCSDGLCAAGEVCDVLNLLGDGPLCYQCLTAGDCPGHQGCDHDTHTCGTCESPPEGFQDSEVFDCRPGDVCSNYWANAQVKTTTQGVCLQRCDLRACPADAPSCQELFSLTTDHKYCVGCLHDSDCARLDAGPGAWCDVSLGFTFQCQPGDFKGPPAP